MKQAITIIFLMMTDNEVERGKCGFLDIAIVLCPRHVVMISRTIGLFSHLVRHYYRFPWPWSPSVSLPTSSKQAFSVKIKGFREAPEAQSIVPLVEGKVSRFCQPSFYQLPYVLILLA